MWLTGIHSRNILATWLLKSFGAEVILWWIFTGDKDPHSFFPQRDISTYLMVRPPCHQFSNHPPSKSLTHLLKPFRLPVILKKLVLLFYLSFSRQHKHQVYCSEFCSVLLCCPWHECSAAHFQVVPAYHTEPSVNQV